jgi:hypothetical protein
MAASAPATQDGFRSDLRVALQTADSALVPKTRLAQLSSFQGWVAFCQEHDHPPSLSTIQDHETRLCLLLVYGLRLRRRLAPKTRKPIRSHTVANHLAAVGTGITQLGFPDPRKQVSSGRLHPLLVGFLKALDNEDDPSTRAYPVNSTILLNLPCVGHSGLLFDLCIVGFFWLLRPAEYLAGAGQTRSTAFRLQDIHFHVGENLHCGTDPSLNDLNVNRIQRATLTFDDQKNAVRGEQISHAANTHQVLCPCKALARICYRLRSNNASADTPIYTDLSQLVPSVVGPAAVTAALRLAASNLQFRTGIDPALISARSLRPGGATSLLCAGVDANTIQLLGHWKSDAMLQYLRVAAHAHNHNMAELMLQHSGFTFSPGAFRQHQPLPVQTPRNLLDALTREGLYHS